MHISQENAKRVCFRHDTNHMIQTMCETYKVVKNTKEQFLRNVLQNPSGFEDGMQYQAAIDAGCDCIITRNKKDFGFAKIPVMTASELLEIVKVE